MRKDKWKEKIKKREDLDKHAEKLLRRMKRDFRYNVLLDGQYLSSGYRAYILNNGFVTKNEAKEWLMDKIWEALSTEKKVNFEKVEEECWIIHGRVNVKYVSIVDFSDCKKEYTIAKDCGKWRISEKRIKKWERNNFEFDLGVRCETLEEAIAFVQEKYDEKTKELIEAFN